MFVSLSLSHSVVIATFSLWRIGVAKTIPALRTAQVSRLAAAMRSKIAMLIRKSFFGMVVWSVLAKRVHGGLDSTACVLRPTGDQKKSTLSNIENPFGDSQGLYCTVLWPILPTLRAFESRLKIAR